MLVASLVWVVKHNNKILLMDAYAAGLSALGTVCLVSCDRAPCCPDLPPVTVV